MATHLLDYHAVEGTVTACGRNFDLKNLPRGVVVSTGDSAVSCQLCLGSDLLKIARAKRHAAALPAGKRGET